jgi:hypothetical protein
MTDTPLWLDAFPHDFEVEHERLLRGMSKVTERVYYPGARRDGGRDGAWLRITPRPAGCGPACSPASWWRGSCR